jgi:two-component system nitrogen regulation response regulator NtrX
MSAPRILVVDDESDIRSTLREVLSDEGYEVDLAGDAAQARAARGRAEPDVVLLDIWMPDTDGITLLREWQAAGPLPCPVVMMSGHGTVETAVEATRLGASDFVEKPLSIAQLLRVVERALAGGRRGRQQGPRGRARAQVAPVGKSRVMQQLREQIAQVATRDTPLLFLGESGSGRESFARIWHAQISRAGAEFVVLVPGSLDESVAAARLRGVAGGAQAGLYHQAEGGTLFVNGLDDLSPAVQRLLAADLEAGSYRQEGGSEELPLNFRVMSSAQPGFEARSGAEPFRRDLLAYLSVVTLRVPPLRDYAEDVPDLLRHYVDRLADELQLPFRRFGVAAQNRLRHYPWPDNIVELKNLVHRLLVLGGEEEIGLVEIERELAVGLPRGEPLVKQDLLALPLREAREAFERAYLQQQLLLCNGKVGQLAKRVGMERTHLYRKLRSLGVDFRHGSDE